MLTHIVNKSLNPFLNRVFDVNCSKEPSEQESGFLSRFRPLKFKRIRILDSRLNIVVP